MNRSIKVLSAALILATATTSGFAATAATAPANTAPAAQQGTATTANAKTSAMSRRTVEEMQTALDRNGAKLDVDGYFGPKTRAALIGFQKSHQLKPSGVLDHATRQALNLPHWQ
jgi:peptidoglycan hydrolase-like protein with peptidoglycan-binding domain